MTIRSSFGIPEARHRCRDDGTPDSLVFVELDRIEAVGEWRHDVRHDEHVGMLQVRDHLIARSRTQQQDAGISEPPAHAGG